MHILGSESLTQICTKLERERKGKRWIFNLSCTPTKSTQCLLEILAQIIRDREDRRTLTCLLSKCEKMVREVRRKGAAAPQIPSACAPNRWDV